MRIISSQYLVDGRETFIYLYLLSNTEKFFQKRGGCNMAEVVAKTAVKKEGGYLYFVDKNGDVCRAVMSRAGRKKGKTKKELVARAGVKKESGYLYFIDGKGNVCRAKMARGRKAAKKSPAKKAVKKVVKKKR